MAICTLNAPMGGGKKVVPKITKNLTANAFNVNLMSLAGNPQNAVELTVNIAANVVVGASNTGGFALVTGNFPVGSKVTLNIAGNAYISGAGGQGGNANGGAGAVGGKALQVTTAISINNQGVIQSGGRGGTAGALVTNTYGDDWGSPLAVSAGGGGGGGGAGSNGGPGGTGGAGNRTAGGTGHTGTLTAGGAGGAGAYSIVGTGSSWTVGSQSATGRAGNAGGGPGSANAVEGNSRIIWLARGTIHGAVV